MKPSKKIKKNKKKSTSTKKKVKGKKVRTTWTPIMFNNLKIKKYQLSQINNYPVKINRMFL